MLLRLSPVEDLRGGPLLFRSMDEAVVEAKEEPLEEEVEEEEGWRERRPPCDRVGGEGGEGGEGGRVIRGWKGDVVVYS